MRGRAFLGAFIALCLIAACSSSSSDDAALREALDRIEALEEELETRATTTVPPTTAPAPATTSTTTTSTTTTSTTTTSTTTTTIPSFDSLEQLFAYWDQRAYEWITINPVPKESGGRPYDEIDWETMFVYSGGPNHLDIEICTYGDGGNLQFLIDWVFENVLMGGLGLSKRLVRTILTQAENWTEFETRERGFYIKTIYNGTKDCDTFTSRKVWITYEG